MNPMNDVICNLLETPFSRWKDDDRRDVLSCGTPVPVLNIMKSCGDKITFNRKFKTTWNTDYKWLCGSAYLQKLFCWQCLLISVKKTPWNSSGFDDLNNITRAFKKHDSSLEHIKCLLGLKEIEKNMNQIVDALSENLRLHTFKYNENVRLNSLFMHYPIKAALFLSKQELAFRGHNERDDSTNKGNFKELLELYIDGSPVEIPNHYLKIKNVFAGNSKTIQNEITECISEIIKNYISKEIDSTTFFSVQVDDTTDIMQHSQCSIIVRFVDSEGIISERFLGFFDVSDDRSADSLFNLLDSSLLPYDYKRKLIGQCYDGAAVMAGHLNGLQKKIKEFAPQAIFLHCLAHRLNLVLQQSCNKIQKCRIFFFNS